MEQDKGHSKDDILFFQDDRLEREIVELVGDFKEISFPLGRIFYETNELDFDPNTHEEFVEFVNYIQQLHHMPEQDQHNHMTRPNFSKTTMIDGKRYRFFGGSLGNYVGESL